MGKKAIVIGAGLSGLSAAYRLQQAGFAVTVIEREQRVGGRVMTIRRDGYVIDAGPDAMTSGYREYLALMEELGLRDQLVQSSPVIGLVRDGRLIDVDPRQFLRLPFTPALSWRAKLQFLRGILRLCGTMKTLDSFELIRSADLDDETLSAQSFGEAHFGKEATDYVIDPLMRLTAGSGARQCSHVGALAGLVSWSAQLLNVKSGLDLLPTTLAARLSVRLGLSAKEVRDVESGGVQVRVQDHSGKQETLHADVAVVATTYDVAADIYPKLRQQAGDYAAHLRWVRLISVSLGYRQRTRSQAYAVQVPTIENPETLLIFLQHNKAGDRADRNASLITVYTDTLATPKLIQESDEALTQWARRQIEPLFPELREHFELSAVTRWPVAGYLASPGFWRRTRALHAAQPQEDRVQLAGDLFGAGSMESAVRWGRRAAERLIRHHGRGAPKSAQLPQTGLST